MGLADYEVRCWTAWYRHVTLVMIVQACLAGICAVARLPTTEPIADERTPTCPLLPLTIPEVRHLLAHLRLPSTSQREPAAGLVVVAALPPEPGKLLPHETSSPGWVIALDAHPNACSMISRASLLSEASLPVLLERVPVVPGISLGIFS